MGDKSKSQMLLELEAMKKELAAKSKKLEKSKSGARIRAHVRKKIREQNEMDSWTSQESFAVTPSFHGADNKHGDTNDGRKVQAYPACVKDNLSNAEFLEVLGVSSSEWEMRKAGKSVTSCPDETLEVLEREDVSSHSHQTKLPVMTDFSVSGSPSTIEYTELDIIPYSQFELVEDFLSDTPSSQIGSQNGKRKQKNTGPLIKRKSPRLSSTPSNGINSSGIKSENSIPRVKKQSVTAQKKAVMIMSVFQHLVDEAKRKLANDSFRLPGQFSELMDLKVNSWKRNAIGEWKQNWNVAGKEESCESERTIMNVAQPAVDSDQSNTLCVAECAVVKHRDRNSVIESGNPATPDCTNEPLQRNCANEPLQRDCTNEPLQRDCISEPLQRDCTNEPLQRDCISEPLQGDCTNEPLQRDCTNEPLQRDCTSESLQGDCTNEPPERGVGEQDGGLSKSQALSIDFVEGGNEIDSVCGVSLTISSPAYATLNSVMKDSLSSHPRHASDKLFNPVNCVRLSQSSAPHFACSSTPKSQGKSTKCFPIHEAPSPICQSALSSLRIGENFKSSLVTNLEKDVSQHTEQTLTSTPKHLCPVLINSLLSPPLEVVEQGDVDSSKRVDLGEAIDAPGCDTSPCHSKLSTNTGWDWSGGKEDCNLSALSQFEPNVPVDSAYSYYEDKLYINDSFQNSREKTPLTKYLKDSPSKDKEYLKGMLNLDSSVKISPWRRIPKTASTPLQIFEEGIPVQSGLVSPVFTPSRSSRSRQTGNKPEAKPLSRHFKQTLKFEGCFQSCSEDGVVQLLHGKLAVGCGEGRDFMVSVQASALTVWIRDAGSESWNPELDWRLSSDVHLLRACLLPLRDKIAVCASGWEKGQPLVTVFVYDWIDDDTHRLNVPGLAHSKMRISEIHLCVSLRLQLLLGVTSDVQYTIHKVTFEDSLQSVSSNQAFDLLRGKMISLTTCQGREKACVSLTWDQRITLWNVEYGIALRTIAMPCDFPCLTAVAAVKAAKGLLFLTTLWRVEPSGGCGGLVVVNPMTEKVLQMAAYNYNIPNTAWRSCDKVKVEDSHVFAISSSGSVSWWHRKRGSTVGHRQSNTATCAAAMENGRVIIGEVHGCVHLYSLC